MGKRAYPPLPTRPQLVAVYPALLKYMLVLRWKDFICEDRSTTAVFALSIILMLTHSKRVDWTTGDHKAECRRLKEESQKVKTAYGSVDNAEISVAILRSIDNDLSRGGGGCGGGGDSGDGGVSLYRRISRVLLPSAAVTEEILSNPETAPKYERIRKNLELEQKGGRWFIDVLSYFLDEEEEEEGDDKGRDADGEKKSHTVGGSKSLNGDAGSKKKNRTGGGPSKNLNGNLPDALFLHVITECHNRRLSFAVDRSAVDYLTVIRAHLGAVRAIMTDADEFTMDKLETLFYALHWLEIQALTVAGIFGSVEFIER